MTFFDYDVLENIWLLNSAGNIFYINEKQVTLERLDNSKVVAALPDVCNQTLGAVLGRCSHGYDAATWGSAYRS